MSKIKTAYEKAMERVNRLNVADVDMASIEYVPKGNAAAAKFLQGEKDFDLVAELERYSEELKPYVKQGMEETLLRNIQLPQNDLAWESARRAMQGLLAIKKEKSALNQIFSELEHLFRYYEQTLDHAYSNVKQSFAARLEPAQRALEKQIGAKVKIDVERQPGFLEEWLRVQGELSVQYEAILAEQKERIKRIT
mgnify:CR=1 FL=1